VKNRLLTQLLLTGIIFIISTTVSLAKAPSWADKKADKEFVYGVGMAFKNKNPKTVYRQTSERYTNDYVEDARQKALKNLAEAISGVNISGDSVNPEFDIEPTRLKGFDIYKIEETKYEYWICVRLSHENAEKMRAEIKVEKARKNLKEGKKELKKTAFDEEFN